MKPSRLIYIVDSSTEQKTVTINLEDGNYRFRIFDSISVFFEAARNSRPDVIFLDGTKAPFDLYQRYSEIKNFPGHSDVPVVFTSKDPVDLEKIRRETSGRENYLQTPYPSETLVTLIERLMSTHQG